MPSTIAEVDKLFSAGAESVTLTRNDWSAIQEGREGLLCESRRGLEGKA